MDLGQLAALGEFVGGIAVLATLAYLAVQVRQNTNAVVTTSHHQMAAALSEITFRIVDNPEVAPLLRKAAASYDGLDEDERMRFDAFAMNFLALFENVFFQRQRGLIDPNMWPHWSTYYKDSLTGDGFRRFWASRRSWYLDEFRSYMEEEVFPPGP